MTVPERKTSFSGRVCELIPDFTPQEIRDLREGMGMTRWEFSMQVGVPVNTITSWELGRRHPSHSARTLLKTIQGQSQHLQVTEAD